MYSEYRMYQKEVELEDRLRRGRGYPSSDSCSQDDDIHGWAGVVMAVVIVGIVAIVKFVI